MGTVTSNEILLIFLVVGILFAVGLFFDRLNSRGLKNAITS